MLKYLHSLSLIKMYTISTAIFLILCGLINTACCIDINDENPTVEIKSGKVQGLWKTSLVGNKYASFEGIPYAKPPVGELRFQPPQPVDPWSETWQANQFRECLQMSFGPEHQIIGSEDCLYINVFVPIFKNVSDNLDVLVHIHGGGFAFGSGTSFLDPFHMMGRRWIFVTMNYRLGALGFLSTQDEVVPGNNGLKDQVLALKWIQENIASFGGNPNSVTLTGFSAGGASTHFHYLSPLSKNLFHRGFSVSGTALSSWALVDDPLELTTALAESFSCEVSDTKTLVECLKKQPTHDIILKTAQINRNFKIVIFGPVVEKNSERAFLSKHPYDLLKNGEVYDVPWISSHTTEEGIAPYLFIRAQKEKIGEKILDVLKGLLHLEKLPKVKESEIMKKIDEFYFLNDKAITESNEAHFVKLFTDHLIATDVRSIELHAKVTKSPVYYYQFNFRGHNTWQRDLGDYYIKGVCHGDDMAYLFGGLIKGDLNPLEMKMKITMQRMLSSYVTTGVPTFEDVKWEPVGDEFNYAFIVRSNVIIPGNRTDLMENNLWFDLDIPKNNQLKDEL